MEFIGPQYAYHGPFVIAGWGIHLTCLQEGFRVWGARPGCLAWSGGGVDLPGFAFALD